MKKELNEIYEVSRDEYVGFLSQIKSACQKTEIIGQGEPYTEVNIFSKDGTRHFATQTITSKENEDASDIKYYIFDMPLTGERCAPRAVRKITLTDKEEVQALFDILAKLQQGEDKND